jgi:AcrR family transcriptional regulator
MVFYELEKSADWSILREYIRRHAMGKAFRTKKPTETKSAAPKRRSRELSTQKLKQAGIEVFSKYGFEASTTKQIAKRAGMNEALIARYFESKAGLLNAIILDFVEASQKQKGNYPAGETVEEEITNFLEAHLEVIEQSRDFIRIAILRALVDPKLSKDLQKYLMLDSEDLLAVRLKAFQAKGLISADRDIVLAANIIQLEATGILLISSISDGFCERFGESCEQLAFNLAYGLQTPLRKK